MFWRPWRRGVNEIATSSSSKICEIRVPRRFRPPSSFSSCILRRAAEYEPAVVNESGGQVAFPRHTAPIPLSAPFLSHLRRTRVTLKARMQRALRRTEINTTLAYYAVAFFSVKSFCHRAVSNAKRLSHHRFRCYRTKYLNIEGITEMSVKYDGILKRNVS